MYFSQVLSISECANNNVDTIWGQVQLIFQQFQSFPLYNIK